MDHQNGYGVEVTGLSPAVTEKDLVDFFSFSGAVEDIDIVKWVKFDIPFCFLIRNNESLLCCYEVWWASVHCLCDVQGFLFSGNCCSTHCECGLEFDSLFLFWTHFFGILRVQRYWISAFASLVGDSITRSLTSGTRLHVVLKMKLTLMYEQISSHILQIKSCWSL